MLASVILAAGESRRMGTPKALLAFPGTPMTPGKITFLEHLLTLAQHPKAGTVRVVLGARADQILNRVGIQPDWVVHNQEWEKGQLSSIRAAIRSLPSSVDGMMLFLVDHPLLSPGIVARLAEAFYESKAAIVLPTFNGKRGHPVIFSSRIFSELLDAPEERGARAVVWAHANEVLEVVTLEEGVVLNLNEPKAYKQILQKRS